MDEATLIEFCARTAHEANRAYCITLGDISQPSWDHAPDWMKVSERHGVQGVIDGNTAESSHLSWLAEKEATGWKYGPIKDPTRKEHPCMVPFADLPLDQQYKDELFVEVVTAVITVFAPKLIERIMLVREGSGI